jgi:serine protease Do
MPARPIQTTLLVSIVTLLCAIAVGLILGAVMTAPKGASPFTPTVQAGSSEGATASGRTDTPDSFAGIIEKALPGVVNISTERIVRGRETVPVPPFFHDPFFRDFFGDDFPGQFPNMPSRRQNSLGSGVIVQSDGYLLTNHHVIEEASEIKVLLNDGRELAAKVVGSDPGTDLAALKIEAGNLTPIPFGDSENIRVGDYALAIGNPFGLGSTVTMGIVSAKGRGNLGIEDYEDFLQTDAAVNPGNSGGALINTAGQLIGINTAIISGSGGNQGIGFAIPATMAHEVLKQLIEKGEVVRGWMGVVIQEVTPEMAEAFQLKETKGVVISDLAPDSPASHAGLQRGDVIAAMNGQPVEEGRSLRLAIARLAPGTNVTLAVVRNNERRNVSVKLGEMPAPAEPKVGDQNGQPEQSDVLAGAKLQPLTPALAQKLGLDPGTRGVLVTSIVPGTAAADVGLRPGDVIQEVNRQPVTSISEMNRMISRAGRAVVLLVNRGGSTIFVTLKK